MEEFFRQLAIVVTTLMLRENKTEDEITLYQQSSRALEEFSKNQRLQLEVYNLRLEQQLDKLKEEQDDAE